MAPFGNWQRQCRTVSHLQQRPIPRLRPRTQRLIHRDGNQIQRLHHHLTVQCVGAALRAPDRHPRHTDAATEHPYVYNHPTAQDGVPDMARHQPKRQIRQNLEKPGISQKKLPKTCQNLAKSGQIWTFLDNSGPQSPQNPAHTSKSAKPPRNFARSSPATAQSTRKPRPPGPGSRRTDPPPAPAAHPRSRPPGPAPAPRSNRGPRR